MSVTRGRRRSRAFAPWWEVIRPDVPFYVVAATFIGVGSWMSSTLGYPRRPATDLSWKLIALRTAIYVLPALAIALAWAVVREGRSLRQPESWIDVLARFFEPARTFAFLLILLLLPPFMATFTAFKTAIPDVNPFTWDRRFMEWDALLHAGAQPWEWLHPLLGHPVLTAAVDFGYALWFPVVWITVIWQAWHGRFFSAARAQFLLAFAMCWIVIGVVAATLLSSAGPIYYGMVVPGTNPFEPLVAYLHGVDAERPLMAVWAQGLLWEAHSDPSMSRFGDGISAMPSMHVSLSVLLALVGFRVHRYLGLAYLAFAALILVGSVHLAWHYAIDGYLAVFLTLLVWWASGNAVDAWMRWSTPPAARDG